MDKEAVGSTCINAACLSVTCGIARAIICGLPAVWLLRRYVCMQVYASQYSDDMNWYRCTLVRHTSSTQVQYVTFTNGLSK